MEETAILLTLTQIEVAFIGFAGIIAAFNFRDGYRVKKGDIIGLEIIIHTGLIGILLSLLPLVLSSFGLSDSDVWAICSGIVSVNYLIVFYYRSGALMNSKFRKTSGKLIFLVNLLIGVLVILINVLNSFNVVFQREFGPFLVSLIIPLCLVGYMFSRLLLLPLWRILKNKDSDLSREDKIV